MDERLDKTLRLYEAELQELWASLCLSDDERDDVELQTRRAFVRGVNAAYHEAAFRFLKSRGLSQQQIADELGKKDRTSISKSMKSKRIDGETLTWLMTQYPDFRLPSRPRAFAYGYASAVTYFRTRCEQDCGAGDDRLQPEQFECLLGLFSSADWLKASVERRAQRKREVEEQVFAEIKRSWNSPISIKSVLGMMQLVSEWGKPFLLCIDMISIAEGE